MTAWTYWLSGDPNNYYDEDAVCTDWPEHGFWVDRDVTNGNNFIEKSSHRNKKW